MSGYCCENLERNATLNCEFHEDEFDCPDCLIYYSKKLKEYGIIIHDGGSSFSVINFCPWCGKQLSELKNG